MALSYIHLDDPGFPHEPWPGQRRLGPYDTPEEALAQAVNDAAHGQGVANAIYSEEDSDALYEGVEKLTVKVEDAHNVVKSHVQSTDDPKDELGKERREALVGAESLLARAKQSKPLFTHAEIKRKGVVEAKRIEKLRARAVMEQEERDRDMQAMLDKPGVTVEDLRAGGLLR